MSGWDVIGAPLWAVLRVALAAGLLWWLSTGFARRHWAGPNRAVDLRSRRPGAGDSDIVAAYNDALLAGRPAGELATFEQVAARVGTSDDHVRAVIARHWAA